MPFSFTPLKLPLGDMTALRRSLHMEPELSGEERVTATILENYLNLYPPDQLMSHLGGYGLAAVYQGQQAGPTVLIRADMDALPIHELNDVMYRSTRPGLAHTCGHDGHMAIVGGLAPLLHAERPRRGRAVLLFQPAEETGAGAQAVLNDPRFETLAPDHCFALHNLPGFALGEVLVAPEIFAAASVGLMVEFSGLTAHAAYPETGRSPARAMAELIQGLQALNPELLSDDPKAFCLVTVVSASLGEASFGISPGSANIMATLRAFDDGVLSALQAQAVALAEGLAARDGLRCHLRWEDAFPATRNAAEASQWIRQAAEAEGYRVATLDAPLRWSEDFGWFTQRCQGAMFGLGAGPDLALHNPRYDFPEALLTPGLTIFWRLLQRLLY